MDKLTAPYGGCQPSFRNHAFARRDHRHASRPADGALPGLSGAFLAFGLAMAPVPEMAAAGAADARRFVRALEPWSSGREYLNFCEGPTDAGAAFDAESQARIIAVRRRVDPQGRLVANHTVTSYDEEAWR